MKTSLVILLTIFTLSSAVELPEGFTSCQPSAPEYSKCADKNGAMLMKWLGPGQPSLKILPIEPLLINKINIGENNGPVTLKQEYKNALIHGLTHGLTLSDTKMDFDKMILYVNSYNPEIRFEADYEMDGHFLVVPVRGKGRSNITLVNLYTTGTVFCETFEKDGEKYLKVKDYHIKLNPEKAILHYDNLFDGDKTLGEPVNALLRNSSDVIFKEYQGPFEDVLSIVFKNIANLVLANFPMNELFLD